jgi:hypothetical protein
MASPMNGITDARFHIVPGRQAEELPYLGFGERRQWRV